jgi:signal transduction histidine kinase
MELEQANQELSVANQRLHEAQQSKNKWIRNISHELATPLTNIRSYTKGMIDGVIQADRKYVQLIYDQSLHFSRMLDDLYEIAKIENNQIAFHLEEVLIRDYLGNFFEKIKWDMERQGIIFTYNDVLPPSAIEPVVLMDKTRINQVLVNLVSNAQRFVGESGRIELELSQREKGQVRITVTDNGSGIKTDELDLVFNRFYKSSHQGKPHQGSGLGLAIAKEIIEYHQGTISVKSEWGEGSCFFFSLPLVEKESC